MDSILLEQNVWGLIFVSVRFYGAMTLFPLFRDEIVPKMLKALLALGFAAIFAPYCAKNMPHVSGGFTVLILAIRELCIGLFIGYCLSFSIWLVENVGNLIDQQRGEQFGAVVNQLTKNPASSISKLLVQGFTVYLVNANALLFLIKFLFVSFAVFPCGELGFKLGVVSEKFISLFCSYFSWLLALALPVIFVMFLLDLTLGLISTFIPQLNVTVISMPLKSAFALFILVFCINPIYHLALTEFLKDSLYEIL